MSKLKDFFKTLYQNRNLKYNKDFLEYFSSYFQINNGENVELEIGAKTKLTNTPVFRVFFEEDSTISFNCSIYQKESNELLGVIINNIVETRKDEFLKTLDDFEVIVKNFNKRMNEKAFKEAMSEVISSLNEEEAHTLTNKVKLFLYINRDESTFSSIHFRIGTEKSYKLKSISSLIATIKNKRFYSYGKDLAFLHTINNFDETAQKVISYYKNKDFYQYRLSTDEIDDLINLYEGQEIFVDDKPYFVEKNPANLKLFVKDDGTFEVEEGAKLEVLTDNYFIFKNKRICKANENYGINQFIKNAIKYPLANINDSLDEYNYAFFEKYDDYFVVDKKLKEKIVNKCTSKINTYFDYENGKVKYVYKILNNGVEEEFYKLSSFDQQRFSVYKEKMLNLGFDEQGFMSEQNKIWEFLNTSLDFLKRFGDIFLSENLCNRKTAIFEPPTFKIKKNGSSSMLDVFMNESPYSEDELYKIYEAIRKKKKFILLKDEFINLEGKNSQDFVDTIDNFQLLENKAIKKENQAALYCGLKALNTNSDYIEIDFYINKVFKEIKNFSNSKMEIGKINGDLRPYQIDGVKWLSILYKYDLGGILADDMGLGKTIETISFLKTIKPKNPVLIVSPKSLIFNWVNEYQKFDKETKTIPIIGTQDEREIIINSIPKNSKSVYLISYETLRMDIEKIKKYHFDTCILDEAQFIKNVKAKKTDAVKELQRDHSFALTGTPIENNIVDLWSIFDFLMPNYFLNLKDFNSNFENDKNYLEIVRKKALPFILRRDKKDVLKDLPPKYDIIYSVEMKDEQRKVYEAVRQQVKNLSETGDSSLMLMLSYLTRLRQICVDPSLYIDNYNGESAKMVALKEIITGKINDNHRILLFSQFVTALNCVERILKDMKLPYLLITGDTPAKKRTEICNDFNNDDKYKVVLISLKAGGTGLNLTGADTVIHLDPWWNIAAENQASDRAHRIGQTKTVEVIKLICENSVEQNVISLQNEKKDLVNKMISDSDEAIKKLSISDMKKIMSL